MNRWEGHDRTGATLPLARGESAHRWVVAGVSLVLIVLLSGFAGLMRHGDTEAHRALSDRFETRAGMTGSFTRSFVNDLAARQQSQAERLLADAEVSQQTFEGVVGAFGFEAAVLLDGDGRLLQVWPARPELIGRDMTSDSTHLRIAVAGQIGVSELVPSAARGKPLVAIAVPFDSAAGRRVFSGAFEPAETSLGAYLDSSVPMAGGSAYLVDRSGNILAGGNRSGGDARELESLPVGVSELGSGQATAAVADVSYAPWRVVLVAPTAVLYAPALGMKVAPWALWFAQAVSGCLVIVLIVRLGRARAHAMATARTDSLTGLPNRRAMQEALDNAASLSSRHQVPLAALMIDVDRFKNINDTYGHDTGDLVIGAIAVALVEATRDSDVAGRWGGEEFLVLLPHTDHVAAVTVAERIREAIASTVVSNGSAGCPVTASIGVAILRHGDAGTLLRKADAALYAAKANGRNRVEVPDESDDEALATAASV
jgi:diguanylate cyclase (GGDEF)-like protein